MNSPEQMEEIKGERKDQFQQERKTRTAPVYVYLLILFAAAFAMLLLAYLIQQRNEDVLSATCQPYVQQAPAFIAEHYFNCI